MAPVTERHVLVTNDFPPKVGGIQAYLWELWRRLDPATFVVLTASSHPDARAFDAEQAVAGFRIERVPEPILYFPTPAARARIRALVERTGATLVLLDPALPLGLLGPTLGVPYGVVLHGAEVAAPGRVPGARQALAHVLRHAALVVSAGGYPAAEAARVLGGRETGARTEGPEGTWVEVPPGVDADRFRLLDGPARRAVRRRIGVPDHGPLVASVSRLVPRKGMDVLIEAGRRLLPSFPELTVAIAGTGRDAPRLARQARRTGSPVRFLGRVPEEDKADLLGAADVFAMVCRDRWGGLEQEGFGIVFLEAAAAGTPQVAGDSGGAAEAVVDGVTGVVVGDPREPAAVASAIRRLLADDRLRSHMAEGGRRRVLEEFGYGNLSAKLAAALAEVKG